MSSRITSVGPVMQLAYVPANFTAALKFWTETMGVGPFFHLRHIACDRVLYKGQPTDVDFSAAIAYWGDTQIELIEQHNDAPSIYHAWRQDGHEGLHHTCLVTDDIAAARATFVAAGAEITQEVDVAGGGKAFYADTGGGPGTMVEVLAGTPEMFAVFEMMKEAARTWDGSEPLRILG